MIPEMEAYSGVKTFRVLRALKTISTVKGTIVVCFIPMDQLKCFYLLCTLSSKIQ